MPVRILTPAQEFELGDALVREDWPTRTLVQVGQRLNVIRLPGSSGRPPVQRQDPQKVLPRRTYRAAAKRDLSWMTVELVSAVGSLGVLWTRRRLAKANKVTLTKALVEQVREERKAVAS